MQATRYLSVVIGVTLVASTLGPLGMSSAIADEPAAPAVATAAQSSIVADQPSLDKSPAAVVAEVPLHPAKARDVVAIVNSDDGPQVKVVQADNAADARHEVAKLQDDSAVASVGIDTKVHAFASPDYSSQQWALSALNAPTAWQTSTGAGVKVAVIDTGVKGSHPDLASHVLAGVDYVDSNGSVPAGWDDENGHGTHVAGIITANADGQLITGIAPSSQIIPVRVLDAKGSGFSSDVDSGIFWAVAHGADIINLSLGGGGYSANDEAAINYAVSHGVAVFAAAGNDGVSGRQDYPAGYPNAVAVSAIDSSGSIASYSNRGPYVDLAAPGTGIYSDSISGGVVAMSGTSMATPYAAGSAALVLSKLRASNPATQGTATITPLENAATDLGAPGRDNSYGYGLVNPERGMEIAVAAPVATKQNCRTFPGRYRSTKVTIRRCVVGRWTLPRRKAARKAAHMRAKHVWQVRAHRRVR